MQGNIFSAPAASCARRARLYSRSSRCMRCCAPVDSARAVLGPPSARARERCDPRIIPPALLAVVMSVTTDDDNSRVEIRVE